MLGHEASFCLDRQQGILEFISRKFGQIQAEHGERINRVFSQLAG